MAADGRKVKSDATDAHERSKDFLNETEVKKMLDGRQEGPALRPRPFCCC